VEQWPRDSVPTNPRTWLVSTGRFKAIASMRRRARFDASLGELAKQLDASSSEIAEVEDQHVEVEDDRLRLIFTCCHPALPPDAQLALTLREMCGLSTPGDCVSFPRRCAYNCQEDRACKAKIRDARIP
jgi:RNA polymerase sigma-70 factor (ECF subfamily)